MSKKEVSNLEILNRIIFLLGKRDQKELTDFLNLKKTAFTDWKSGKSNSYRKYLIEIAEFFNVSLDYLVYGKEDFQTTNEKELTENEQELLEIFNKFNEREQIKIIGKIEDWFETKQKRESKIKITDSENQSVSNQPTQSKWRITARRTDGVYESRLATPEEIEKLEQLKDAPEPEY